MNGEAAETKPTPPPAFGEGHWYSPVVSIPDVLENAERIWTDELESAGIDYAPDRHLRFIQDDLAKSMREYNYPQFSDGTVRYYEGNPAFAWLDSRALFTILRKYKPARMVEVGSGYSSLLTADVNTRFLDGKLNFVCIEPYPMDFLKRPIPGITGILEQKVQDVDLDLFRDLQKGDILFIDSSHVAKTGSDVNHLLFKVLPALRKGVIVHFHDIFLPREYPKIWVTENGLSWNEQYMLRALLMGSNVFEILFGCAYALYKFPDALREALGGKVFGGGSLWLTKAGDF